MLTFIESIIKLLVNLLFADQLAQENQRLKKENQQLQQLEEKNQKLIQTNFNLVKKYIALNQEKEELARKLEQYQSSRPDINQQFNAEDFKVIDQLLQDFNSSEGLTI